ncbi:hypothetical protein G7Y89_g9990 [Cudoniella acicularis]|uniref:FAD-binding domain-containing protein n=1 Tax=Cudoniella acicularis TaxID=354080 RepID=A0A8H4VZM1_9HELO|nr:hypothetical protein G7Y89_g9990 [Cudoniella acicularis]
MSKHYYVIIAGAGPIRLFLACELGLAGVSVLVLERDLKPESSWKVSPLGRLGLNRLLVEAFYQRGLLSKLFGTGERYEFVPKKSVFQFGGHFAGIGLNANKLDLDRWKYRLSWPALAPAPTTIERIETILTERAESLGVTILRVNGFTKIAEQDIDSVMVEAGKGQSFHSRWLVGCDGGQIIIRKAARFDFVGTEAKFTGYAVKCDFDHPEKLQPGFHLTKAGMYIISPGALHLVDFDSAEFDRTQEITQDHLQDVLNRITGTTDVKVTTVHLASSFTDRSKQTTSYRKGRILLASDAAHIHSPLGAQGLNVGLGDAMNLGWKLAATIRMETKSDKAVEDIDLAPLDTYESERHPIAAWVLEWTRAQVSTLQSDLYGEAIQALLRDLIDTTDETSLFIGHVWGLSQRYSLGEGEEHAHPLVGSSVPDFELVDGSRLGPKIERDRGLLVDFEDDLELKELVLDKYESRVDYMSASAKDRRGIRTLLVQPDRVVAWVVEDNVKPNVNVLRASLEQWLLISLNNRHHLHINIKRRTKPRWHVLNPPKPPRAKPPRNQQLQAPPKKKVSTPKPKPPFDDKLLEKALKASYSALKRAVKQNWPYGYEDQGEMVCDMADLLNKWQGLILRVAIGPGKQLAEAYTTMVLVGSWITKLRANELNTRTEWGDYRDELMESEVTDESGEEIYKGMPERIQTCMWRDLALKAIVAKDKKTLDAIMEHCHVFDNEVVDQLFSIDDKENPHANDGGYPIHNEWYTDDEDMQKAVPVFKKMLTVK